MAGETHFCDDFWMRRESDWERLFAALSCGVTRRRRQPQATFPETRRTHRVRPLTSPLRTETPTQNTHNPTKISLAPAHTPTLLPLHVPSHQPAPLLLQRLLPDPISILRSPAPTRRYIYENTPTTSHTHFTTLLHESLPLSLSPAASSSHTGANLNESWHDSRQ